MKYFNKTSLHYLSWHNLIKLRHFECLYHVYQSQIPNHTQNNEKRDRRNQKRIEKTTTTIISIMIIIILLS